jgi:glycosyltransferase involved in cell wall biosynthesis
MHQAASVRTILFVIPDLAYSGSARQLMLLAQGLHQRSFAVTVAVLGSSSPWSEALQAAGVAVQVLHGRRSLDLRAILALRRLVRSLRPDVVHVWKAAALVPALVGIGGASRILLSRVLPTRGRPGPLQGWLFRQAGEVLALGPHEVQGYRAIGIPDAALSVALPAVEVCTGSSEPANLPEVPPEQPVLLGIGPLHRHKGFRELIWALDILLHRRTAPVHLVLAGTGEAEQPLRRFAHQIGVSARVSFLGPCPDLAPWLARATLVCVPSLRPAGFCAALEGMAAGKPVVASRRLGLEEIVVEDQTGYLVDPGDKGGLARQINRLLDAPDICRQLGAAGQARAAEVFTCQRLLDTCAEIYLRRRRSGS